MFPPAKRQSRLTIHFTGRPTVFDLIQAHGIPHTEVGRVTREGHELPWQRHLQGEETLSVSANHAQPSWEPYRFILDVHLGRLARRLRLLGFDCVYRNDLADPEIVNLAGVEKRIVLTRDKGILYQRAVEHGYFIRSTYFQRQVDELFSRYRLAGRCKPFSRCSLCNGLLHDVAADDFRQQLPVSVFEYKNRVSRCEACKKLYWTGTHYHKLLAWISDLKSNI